MAGPGGRRPHIAPRTRRRVVVTAAVALLLSVTPAITGAASAVAGGRSQISAVDVNGTGTNYLLAPFGTPVVITGVVFGSASRYLEFGWLGAPGPLTCVDIADVFAFSVDLGPSPTQVGRVVAHTTDDPTCPAASWQGGGNAVVAEVAATPAQHGASGILTVSRTKFVNDTVNSRVQRVNRPVAVRAEYTIAATPGARDQIQYGWLGSAAPVGCAEQGVGGAVSDTRSFDLGMPPELGANYIAFGYAQYFTCTVGDWFVPDTRQSKAVTALVYVPHLPKVVYVYG